ncbi:MAG TPA: hypothetical protein VK254_03330 [Candidatus Bathyarchaeia archaeon]|nr:hypothetical protein [Candidatus Bathyarchaeia archaeon]
MAKSKEQIKARNLRKKGVSIRDISKRLKVSRGSASLWCRDVVLTEKQIEKLHEQMVKGGYLGRLKGAHIQREIKQQKIQYYSEKGKIDIQQIKKRELLIAGLALYWGEGSKTDSRVRFSNSDPVIVKFIMKWFREVLKVSEDRFMMRITINRVHQKRLNDVNAYWSRKTDIPIEQFRKTILIKAKNEKIYENHFQHYGILCIGIAKSSDLFYQIVGWLKALGETI